MASSFTAVRNGGRGILASAALTHTHQQCILPDGINALEDQSVRAREEQWLKMSGSVRPTNDQQHIQQVWDGLMVKEQETQLLPQAPSEVDRARLLTASSPHSGDWLSTCISYCLDGTQTVCWSNKTSCDTQTCEPHVCARRLHGLACRRSASKQKCGESCMILTSTIFDWSTRVTDRQMDGR